MSIALGFDFDHTLGLDHGLEVKAYYQLAAQRGPALDDEDEQIAAFIADVLARFRSDELTLDEAVGAFCTEYDVSQAESAPERYREICYALVEVLVTPLDGAREVLAELNERGVRTAILTNGWSPLQHKKIAKALGYGGPVIVSDALGAAKPAGAAFDALVDVLGCARADCWYVGDNPGVDIVGAQDAGLHGVWFDWEDLRYPAGMRAPDVTIHALADIRSRVLGARAEAEKLPQ